MPARDNRYSHVGENSAGDLVYERTYDNAQDRGTDYESMTKAELEALLEHMALPKTGNKAELIERLREAQ